MKSTLKLANVAKALSDPTRLKIVHLLKEKMYCVNALVRLLHIRQPAVSQHLRILRQARIVIAEKKGYWVHYSLDTNTMIEYTAELTNLFRTKGGEAKCAAKKTNVNTRKN